MLKNQKIRLDEITILIITYKRYGFLKRLLSFFASAGDNYNLLVLDSTPNNPTEEDLLYLLKSNPKLKWVRYDSSIFFANKIADGCKYINTKYSVLCADDDFLLPSGISKSIDFLEYNLEYSCCHGIYYDYEFQNSRKLILGNIYGKMIGGEEISSLDRVVNYFNGKTSYYSFYAVHRTSDFKFIWESCKIYVLDWGLSEIFPSALSLILGKMKVLEIPYSIREKNNFVWYDNEREEQMYSLDKIDLFINGLVEVFKNEQNVVGEVLKNIFNEKLKRSKLKKKVAASTTFPLNKVSIITKIKNKLRNYYTQYYKPRILLKKENDELIKALLLKNSDNINTSRIDYSNQSNII
jgi:glycosyltransferase domain-containing protein